MTDLELAKEVEKIVMNSRYSLDEAIEIVKSYYLTANKDSSLNKNAYTNIICKNEDVDNQGRVFNKNTGEVLRDLI